MIAMIGYAGLYNNINNIRERPRTSDIGRVAATMLPRSIPPLNKEQWKFIEERLDKPASPETQKRLQEAVENAKKIKRE